MACGTQNFDLTGMYLGYQNWMSDRKGQNRDHKAGPEVPCGEDVRSHRHTAALVCITRQAALALLKEPKSMEEAALNYLV